MDRAHSRFASGHCLGKAVLFYFLGWCLVPPPVTNESITALGRTTVSSPCKSERMNKEQRWSRGRAPDSQSKGTVIPTTAVSKLRQFRLPHICLCLSEETLKAGGPFYLVSISREVKVKDPTQGVNVWTQ